MPQVANSTSYIYAFNASKWDNREVKERKSNKVLGPG